MTTKPENQQIQQGATAPSRGFDEQKREPTEALLIGVEREIEGACLNCRIEYVKAAAASRLSVLAAFVVSANPREKEWGEKEIRRLIALGMED